MSELKARLQEDVKAAMRAGEKQRLSTLRLAMAAIKQREVDDRVELDDAAILAILEKMLKQRRDSIEQFEKAGRDDLVAQETAEVEVLTAYMPRQLDEAELAQAVDATITSLGASSMQDMGKVMGQLKGELSGRADMAQVSQLVRARLSGN